MHWTNKPETSHIVKAANELMARTAAVDDSGYGHNEFYTASKCKTTEL